MVTKLLERAIEIEGLLRIIRDGHPLPETYTLLSNKAVELAEEAMLLEESASSKDVDEAIDSTFPQSDFQESSITEESVLTSVLTEEDYKKEEDKKEETISEESDQIHDEGSEDTGSGDEEIEEQPEEQPKANNEAAEKNASPAMPMIDMAEESDDKETDVNIEPTVALSPIVITMDSVATDNEDTTSEELSETEEEIEELPYEEKTNATEQESTPNEITYKETTEEDDDILLTLEEADEEAEVSLGYNKNEDGKTIEIKEDKPELSRERVEPDPDIKITEKQEHPARNSEYKIVPAIKRQKKLKSAFSLNDRFLYARELFEGNMKMFDSTLDFIEGIEYYSIIEDYFYNELEWDPENPTVASFMDILRPQFKD